MPGPRFFLPQPLAVATSTTLSQSVYAHAIKVLRLRQGAEIVLFNGTGGEFHAVIEHIDRKSASAHINAFCTDERAARLHIKLVLAISKAAHMDYALQKATELGVGEIVPVYSEYSGNKGRDPSMDKRLARWRSIIISACEQCGCNRLPQLRDPLPFCEWAAQGENQGIVLDPKASATIGSLPEYKNAVCVVVGAEGGFSEAELQLAEHAGLVRVALGARIMRTETAAVVALAAIHTLWGDFT